MKVLLIDADSTIPNIPLMKLGAYHKHRQDSVDFIKLNIPYYPNRKKTKHIMTDGYDKYYCSVIFDGNKEYVVGNNIIFGGTGINLNSNLSEEVEKFNPDYSIYPDNDISYGFITRGCVRNCTWCKVPQKEGYIRKVSNIDDIIKHKKVKFLDNNILAYSKHKEILSELIEKKIKCQFNQGLDIRLIDEENSKLLSNLNYIGEYIFAFDNWNYRKIIEERLQLLNWRKNWQLKFFVYVHPDMKLSDTIKRIIWLKKNYCLSYLMRNINCWNSDNHEFFVDVAAYCNQVHLFKSLEFNQFLKKRHLNRERILKSQKLWDGNI